MGFCFIVFRCHINFHHLPVAAALFIVNCHCYVQDRRFFQYSSFLFRNFVIYKLYSYLNSLFFILECIYILLLILFNLVFSTATVLSIFFIPNLINSKLYSSLYSHIFLILKFILFYILNFNWSRVLDVSCPYFLFRTSVIYKLYSYRALVQNFLYVTAFPVSGACGPSHRHHL